MANIAAIVRSTAWKRCRGRFHEDRDAEAAFAGWTITGAVALMRRRFPQAAGIA